MSLNSAGSDTRRLSVVLIAIGCLSFSASGVGGIVSKETPERFELEFWRAIKDSADPEQYAAYIEEFPQGKFAPLARIRLKALERQLAEAEPVAAPEPEKEPEKESVPAISPSAPGGSELAATNPEPSRTAEKAQTPAVVPVVVPEKSTAGVTEAAAENTPEASTPTLTPEQLVRMASGPFRDCALCPEMIEVPMGEFRMGTNNGDASSAPEHPVTLSYQFSVGRFEVIHEQWDFCVVSGGCKENSRNKGLEPNIPAINLSWNDARDYVSWLASYTLRPYRLPTEAEWEYFARAGSVTGFWWGDELVADSANCSECGGNWGRKLPAPVDSFASNNFGLVGTSGGVAEWVQDCWSQNYQQAPADGSALDADNCVQRVLRGGSWRNKVEYLNSASRLNYDHNVRYVTNGFRVVLDADDFMQ